jgi:hypothetical protein
MTLLEEHDEMLRITSRWAVARRLFSDFDEAYSTCALAIHQFNGDFKVPNMANFGKLSEWNAPMLLHAMRFELRRESWLRRRKAERTSDHERPASDLPWTFDREVIDHGFSAVETDDLLNDLAPEFPALVSFARTGDDAAYAQAHGIDYKSASMKRRREARRLRATPERIAA